MEERGGEKDMKLIFQLFLDFDKARLKTLFILWLNLYTLPYMEQFRSTLLE